MTSSTIEAPVPPAEEATAAPWHALAKVTGRLMDRIRHRRRIRRATNQLMELDDRMLADMGLSRGDVWYVVRYGRLPPR